MNWSLFKNFIQSPHDRFIVIENDAPRYVIIGFEEYERLVQWDLERAKGHLEENIESANGNLQEAGVEAEVNLESELLREGQELRKSDSFGTEMARGLRIEDLPF